MKGVASDSKLYPDNFEDWVDEILSETDAATRQDSWTELLSLVPETKVNGCFHQTAQTVSVKSTSTEEQNSK